MFFISYTMSIVFKVKTHTYFADQLKYNHIFSFYKSTILNIKDDLFIVICKVSTQELCITIADI